MPSISETNIQSTRNRQRIIQSATNVFMADGYHASMDAIAARAGVVKQTLYNHFACKNELFAEVVRNVTKKVVITLDQHGDDLRTALFKFGMALREVALSPQGLALFRVLIAEAPRFPDLAKAIYAEGPEQASRQLARFIRRAMRAGQLREDTPEFAAASLIGMLLETERTRRLYGIQARSAAEDQVVVHIVDCFLRAFAP
jgi:TetR/AcrR family transcriptional regulator, mexJK operon transcriptional repressor